MCLVLVSHVCNPLSLLHWHYITSGDENETKTLLEIQVAPQTKSRRQRLFDDSITSEVDKVAGQRQNKSKSGVNILKAVRLSQTVTYLSRRISIIQSDAARHLLPWTNANLKSVRNVCFWEHEQCYPTFPAINQPNTICSLNCQIYFAIAHIWDGRFQDRFAILLIQTM